MHVCCSVLQCVAVCYSVLQCVAAPLIPNVDIVKRYGVLCVAAWCCSVLQGVAVC